MIEWPRKTRMEVSPSWTGPTKSICSSMNDLPYPPIRASCCSTLWWIKWPITPFGRSFRGVTSVEFEAGEETFPIILPWGVRISFRANIPYLTYIPSCFTIWGIFPLCGLFQLSAEFLTGRNHILLQLLAVMSWGIGGAPVFLTQRCAVLILLPDCNSNIFDFVSDFYDDDL